MRIVDTLQREADFLANGENGFHDVISELKTRAEQHDGGAFVSNIESETETLMIRLNNAREEQMAIKQRRDQLANKRYELSILIAQVEAQANALSYKHSACCDQLESLNAHLQKDGLLLQKFLQLNPINDAFHIWYSGPFATINDFRLGRLSTHPIDWPEINSALGEAAAAVYTIAAKAGIQFKKFGIIPMGCFSRICRTEDRRTTYNLFTDGSFSLFPKRNFNLALTGFLTCIEEVGIHVVDHDPTLQLPYAINSTEGKINNHTITLTADEEQWTRALKYVLSDIKWIIAWSTKHLQHLN
mmetsp:Transcript_13026/g.19650  ORF Transcript_13026/g.19650 Transcript_13026/m.19650 type:complete len:301 (-) Transcript_13026:168-1070(-)